MRRKICLFMLCMLSVVMNVAGQVEFGVRLGGSYSSLTQRLDDMSLSGGKVGFRVGGLAEVPVYKGLSFRPEVAFVHQGGSYYSQLVETEMAAFNRYKYYSLQLPLDLAYTFYLSDVRLSVFAGPTLDFSLFGKMKTRNNQPDTDIHFGIEQEENLRRFDLGVNVGLAVEYSKFFFSIDALCGTLDRRSVKREGESAVFQNNITFSLGYFFRK